MTFATELGFLLLIVTAMGLLLEAFRVQAVARPQLVRLIVVPTRELARMCGKHRTGSLS